MVLQTRLRANLLNRSQQVSQQNEKLKAIVQVLLESGVSFYAKIKMRLPCSSSLVSSAITKATYSRMFTTMGRAV